MRGLSSIQWYGPLTGRAPSALNTRRVFVKLPFRPSGARLSAPSSDQYFSSIAGTKTSAFGNAGLPSAPTGRLLADSIIASSDRAAVLLPAEVVRQLRGYEDAGLNKQIADLWGVVRESPEERKRLISEWKVKLTKAAMPAGDVNLGRTVFARTCLSCHTLYAVGGKVGPEITGANRGSIDYLLENILDPSAVIPKEYAATRFVPHSSTSPRRRPNATRSRLPAALP